MGFEPMVEGGMAFEYASLKVLEILVRKRRTLSVEELRSDIARAGFRSSRQEESCVGVFAPAPVGARAGNRAGIGVALRPQSSESFGNHQKMGSQKATRAGD